MEHLEHLVCRKDVCEIIEELPDNAYFIERGSVTLSEIVANGVVPLRRYFTESPNIIAYFTVHNKSESNKNFLKSSKGLNVVDSNYTTCYRLLASAFQVKLNAISIIEPQVYDREEVDIVFRYIAYLRTRPFDTTMLPLSNLILNGSAGVENKIQAWINEGNHYISTTNADEQSLLHIAAQESNFSTVKWLVDHKADVTLPDKAGWTPIFCALNASDIRSAHYIAQNGGIQKNALTSNGSNPLHYLARCIPSNTADTEKFMYVLNKCIEIYGTDASRPNASYETPLHRAALYGNIVLVKKLLDSVDTISLDPNSKNRRGHSCVHLAIASGNQELIQLLVSTYVIDVPPSDSPASPHQLCQELNKPNLLELLPKNGKIRFANLSRHVLVHIFTFLKADHLTCARCLCVSKDIRQIVASVGENSSVGEYWSKLDKIERHLQRKPGYTVTPPPYNHNDYDYLFKMLVIGDKGVGATTFCNNAIGEGIKFPSAGVEASFGIKIFNVDGKRVKVQLWHKPTRFTNRGLEDMRHFRGASVIFIVYDPSNKDSISNLKVWLVQIQRYACENVEKIFIATKSDIPERATKQEVSTALIENDPTASAHHMASESVYPIIIETRIDKPNTAQEAIKLAAKLRILVMSYTDPAPPQPPPPKKKGFLKFFK